MNLSEKLKEIYEGKEKLNVERGSYVLRSSDNGSDGSGDFRIERIGVNAVHIDVCSNVKTRHFLTVEH